MFRRYLIDHIMRLETRFELLDRRHEQSTVEKLLEQCATVHKTYFFTHTAFKILRRPAGSAPFTTRMLRMRACHLTACSRLCKQVARPRSSTVTLPSRPSRRYCLSKDRNVPPRKGGQVRRHDAVQGQSSRSAHGRGCARAGGERRGRSQSRTSAPGSRARCRSSACGAGRLLLARGPGCSSHEWKMSRHSIQTRHTPCCRSPHVQRSRLSPFSGASCRTRAHWTSMKTAVIAVFSCATAHCKACVGISNWRVSPVASDLPALGQFGWPQGVVLLERLMNPGARRQHVDVVVGQNR